MSQEKEPAGPRTAFNAHIDSGTYRRLRDFSALHKREIWLVMDEAIMEFASGPHEADEPAPAEAVEQGVYMFIYMPTDVYGRMRTIALSAAGGDINTVVLRALRAYTVPDDAA